MSAQQKEILNTLEITFPIPSCGTAVPHAEPEDPIAEEGLPQEYPMEIHESSLGEPVRQDKRRKALSLRTEHPASCYVNSYNLAFICPTPAGNLF